MHLGRFWLRFAATGFGGWRRRRRRSGGRPRVGPSVALWPEMIIYSTAYCPWRLLGRSTPTVPLCLRSGYTALKRAAQQRAPPSKLQLLRSTTSAFPSRRHGPQPLARRQFAASNSPPLIELRCSPSRPYNHSPRHYLPRCERPPGRRTILPMRLALTDHAICFKLFI
jgi:hypothetical protein